MTNNTDIKKLLESIDSITAEGSMAKAATHKSGSKFGGYWKGTDKSTPEPGMGVGGSCEESDEQQIYEKEKFLGEPYIRENDSEQEDCPDCGGSGTEYGETCVRCGGKGYLIKDNYNNYDFNIGDADEMDESKDEYKDEFDDFLDSLSDEEMYDYDQEDRHQGKSDKQLDFKLRPGATIDDTTMGEGYADRMMADSAGIVEDDLEEDSWSDGTDQWTKADSGPWGHGELSGGAAGGGAPMGMAEAAKKPVSIASQLRRAHEEGAFIGIDQISKDKQGNFIFRKGYYYRHGMDSQKFAERVESELRMAGFVFKIIDQGDHWAAFRGGASVKASSHFWAKVQIADPSADQPVEEAEDNLSHAELSRASSGATLRDPADREQRALWMQYYHRAKQIGKSDSEARFYADSLLRTEPKYADKKFNESLEDITEELRDAFEDYVKNKAEPEDKKERVTITYKDGHTQTKSVTKKEKNNYETSSHVSKVEPAKDGKGRLDDAKLDESDDLIKLQNQLKAAKRELSVSKTGPQKENVKTKIAALQDKIKKSKKLTEGADMEEVESAISHRIMMQHVELLEKYGLDTVLEAIEQVAMFHAGAEELGSSDISIMVNQVRKDLERGNASESINEETNTAEMSRRKKALAAAEKKGDKDAIDRERLGIRKLKGEMELRARDKVKESTDPWKTKQFKDEELPRYESKIKALKNEYANADKATRANIKAKLDKAIRARNQFLSHPDTFKESKTASRARSILQKKLDDIDKRNKKDEPKKEEPKKEVKESTINTDSVGQHAMELQALMNPETRDEAFAYIDHMRDKFGPKFSLDTYRMAQQMRKAGKEHSVNEAIPTITSAGTTNQPVVPGQQPTAATATPITTPQTTAQQPPAPKGTPTAVPAAGQPVLPVAGQAGGAPVAPPAGTPKAPSGTAVNATSTPVQQLATSLGQLAQPGSQMAAKKAADALARVK